MTKHRQRDPKTEDLKRTGTLNPHAKSVTDPLFQQNPFFDPRDLLQARYEMLRRHTAEQMSILEAAAAFGVSRPTFYQAQASLQRSGLAGLLPARRGPKGGHKLTDEVLDYVASLRESEPKLTTVQCVQAVQKRFAMTIHRRSLERALARRKKKTAWPDLKSSVPDDAAAAYEVLRPYLIHPAGQSESTPGPAVLLCQGMLAWARASQPVPASSVSPSPAGGPPLPSEVSRELVQVMAELILHYGKDRVYA